MSTSERPYNGYGTRDHDVIIDGCRLIPTCPACPEQYEVFDDATGQQIGYLRLRHGYFRADYPDCGGDTVYEKYTRGDGCFEPDERQEELTKAVRAILDRIAKENAH